MCYIYIIMSQVLYRKYRPQTFAEVIGQDVIKTILQNALKHGQVAHAYLFTGPRGVGKTTVARILAKAVNCLHMQQDGDADNKCANCEALRTGRFLDLVEIDAASYTGVDNIREIIEHVRFAPTTGKYKVFIIDEVHMLSKAAFNALLKTLEEPPAHVIFILATTEFHKVPETIVSRCQVFTFKKASDVILRNMVQMVAKKEGYELDNGSAELLAILGDGSFRDALSELQKILNFSKTKKVSREDVEKITGAPQTTLVNDFISAIASKDLEKGMKAVQSAGVGNLDMKLYFKLIIAKFRVGMIIRYAPKLTKEMSEDLGKADLEFLQDLVKKDKEGMFRSKTLAILLSEYENIDNAFITELPLELALVKILGEEKAL